MGGNTDALADSQVFPEREPRQAVFQLAAAQVGPALLQIEDGRTRIAHAQRRIGVVDVLDLGGPVLIFVYLVDIDDAALRQLNVEVCRLQQAQENVLDILADIARLGERGRIGNGERNVQDFGERLRKERFAAARRADEQDIALLQLHIGVAAVENALVMVIHRHGQGDLRLILTDDITVHIFLDLFRRGQMIGNGQLGAAGLIHLLVQDRAAQLHAFVADIGIRSGHDALDLCLRLAAEGASDEFFCQIYFLLWALALIDHLIHNAVFLRLLGREEMVALAVAGDLFNGSAGVLRQNFIQAALHIRDALGVDLDIRDLTLRAAGRLMDHDLRVRQGEALALRAGRQQERAHGRGHADADRGNIALDILHGVINRKSGRYHAARAVDVKRNILVRIFAFKKEQLRPSVLSC